MVFQDTRGQFAAEGEYHPFFQKPADGADTIAWAARARPHDGIVGRLGLLDPVPLVLPAA